MVVSFFSCVSKICQHSNGETLKTIGSASKISTTVFIGPLVSDNDKTCTCSLIVHF